MKGTLAVRVNITLFCDVRPDSLAGVLHELAAVYDCYTEDRSSSFLRKGGIYASTRRHDPGNRSSLVTYIAEHRII